MQQKIYLPYIVKKLNHTIHSSKSAPCRTSQLDNLQVATRKSKQRIWDPIHTQKLTTLGIYLANISRHYFREAQESKCGLSPGEAWINKGIWAVSGNSWITWSYPNMSDFFRTIFVSTVVKMKNQKLKYTIYMSLTCHRPMHFPI